MYVEKNLKDFVKDIPEKTGHLGEFFEVFHLFFFLEEFIQNYFEEVLRYIGRTTPYRFDSYNGQFQIPDVLLYMGNISNEMFQLLPFKSSHFRGSF